MPDGNPFTENPDTAAAREESAEDELRAARKVMTTEYTDREVVERVRALALGGKTFADVAKGAHRSAAADAPDRFGGDAAAADVDRRFNSYTAPLSGDAAARMDEVLVRARELAFRLLDLVPAGRDRSAALSALELAAMHARAGIARQAGEPLFKREG